MLCVILSCANLSLNIGTPFGLLVTHCIGIHEIIGTDKPALVASW